MTPPVLVEGPAALPVDLVALKKHLRIDASVTEDDDELTEKIEAATRALDGYSGLLGRCLISQKWAVDTGCHYSTAYRLPLSPVSAVAISYIDGAGAGQALADDYCRLVVDAIGPRVELATGYAWPPQAFDGPGMTITFTAGYGAEPKDVPADIRLAIMLAVELAFDRPEGPRFEALQRQYDDIVRRNRRGNI